MINMYEVSETNKMIEQENLIERGYENLVSRVSEIGIRAKKCL